MKDTPFERCLHALYHLSTILYRVRDLPEGLPGFIVQKDPCEQFVETLERVVKQYHIALRSAEYHYREESK